MQQLDHCAIKLEPITARCLAPPACRLTVLLALTFKTRSSTQRPAYHSAYIPIVSADASIRFVNLGIIQTGYIRRQSQLRISFSAHNSSAAESSST